MKNLYPKGKGKIHPSPASPAACAGGGGGGGVEVGGPPYDALAVLKLLPAAVLALTAALGSEDQEVLAYLITRSLCSAAGVGGTAGGDGRPRCRRVVGSAHSPAFDCGCFDCYTIFWSRWDCSPGRELIHQAIEAFEEHLASSEKLAGGKGRRRERREKGAKKGKEKKKKRNQKQSPPPPAESSEAADENESILEEPSVAEAVLKMKVAELGGGGDEDREEEERHEEEEEEEEEVVEEAEVTTTAETESTGSQRRSGWSDMTGFFNLRLWSLWSPAA